MCRFSAVIFFLLLLLVFLRASCLHQSPPPVSLCLPASRLGGQSEDGCSLSAERRDDVISLGASGQDGRLHPASIAVAERWHFNDTGGAATVVMKGLFLRCFSWRFPSDFSLLCDVRWTKDKLQVPPEKKKKKQDFQLVLVKPGGALLHSADVKVVLTAAAPVKAGRRRVFHAPDL